MAMVLGYYGVHMALATISAGTRPSPISYMRADGIAPFARQLGLDATRVKQANVNTIRSLIANGYFVTVLERLKEVDKVLHFRVVWALDDQRQVFSAGTSLAGP
ncbi:hypothetical protein HNQ10_000574 [Deinococcus metallilatus]|uniref:Uncharacterized protein n=1 Tax=Deinococcus metallilatus TaxID=1211322 RepID=A0ABR6MP89_9DEIO|nr:hypothetical protein [Deinococcus metallilatus]